MINLLSRVISARRFRSVIFTEDDLAHELSRSLVFIIILFFTHVLAMRMLEGMTLGDAVWLTLTTATTVGYGDVSASTPLGRSATVILLYFGGIFVLAKAAGDYFDYRIQARLRKKCGNWSWRMHDHILIINTPRENGEEFFSRVIEQLRASERYADKMIQIVTRQYPQGLPDRLAKMEGLAHYNGDGSDPDTLAKVDADKACVIVVLARSENDVGSDSRTFDILDHVNTLDVSNAIVLAECVDDRNRPRFRKLGAEVLIRPVRAYPEMLVRGLVAPGAEQIIENMFTSSSDEYARYDIQIKDRSWSDVVCTLMRGDLGTAVGYIDAETGTLETNPPANMRINSTALFLIASEGAKASLQQIHSALGEDPNGT